MEIKTNQHTPLVKIPGLSRSPVSSAANRCLPAEISIGSTTKDSSRQGFSRVIERSFFENDDHRYFPATEPFDFSSFIFFFFCFFFPWPLHRVYRSVNRSRRCQRWNDIASSLDIAIIQNRLEQLRTGPHVQTCTRYRFCR